MEFCATVAPPEEAKAQLLGFIKESKDIPQTDYADDKRNVRLVGKWITGTGLVSLTYLFITSPFTPADQADALLDSYYYSLNAAAKAGVNLSSVFDIGKSVCLT